MCYRGQQLPAQVGRGLALAADFFGNFGTSHGIELSVSLATTRLYGVCGLNFALGPDSPAAHLAPGPQQYILPFLNEVMSRELSERHGQD